MTLHLKQGKFYYRISNLRRVKTTSPVIRRNHYNALRVQYNNAFRVLVGLPHYSHASGMFVEERVDGFHGIVPKRCH